MINQWYNPTGNPAAQSRASSATDRAEFASIGAAFNLLPPPAMLAGDQQNYAVDTGVLNALAVPYPANVTGLTDGLKVTVRAAFTNTGPSAIVVGSSASTPIVRSDGTATQAGDYVQNEIIELRYSSVQSAFQLLHVGAASVATAATNAAAAAASAAAAAASATVVGNLKITEIFSFYQNFGAF